MSNPDSDTIIYNATVNNNTSVSKVLQFSDYRRQNILDHAEDYYVRAFEAKIPVMSVPFFQMKANTMSVTIIDKTVFLIPIQLNSVNGDIVFIFYIQQFLDSLNIALAEAHVQTGTAGYPPKMIYDYNNDLLLFYVSSIYYNLGVNPIQIFFNSRLMYKLTGFMNEFINTPGKEYRIMYENYAASYTDINIFGQTTEGIFMPSQAKFYKDLLEFQSIILTTRSLKVNEQYISSGNTDENRSLPILAEIPILFDELNSSKNLIFSQNYPKWIPLNCSGALKTLDMFAYVVGDDFITYELFILPGQKFNIRLEFNKKNLVKNYTTDSS